jgi:hypothetical protein
MPAIGLALFLYTAAANITQPVAPHHPAGVTAQTGGIASPDHAPPHPLSPRVPLVEQAPKTFWGAALSLAKAALTNHGH